MAKKETVHPWQQIEEQAFHAFREWPLWLVLRQRELAAQQSGSRTTARLRVLVSQLSDRRAINRLCFADQPRNEMGELSIDEGFECG